MRDFVDLGVTTPPLEDCAQLGSKSYDYYDRARLEARALISQLRRLLGPEPPGAQLKIRSNPHDFGTYLTVACYFDPDDRLCVDYAARCDRECPQEWDDPGRQELAEPASRGKEKMS